MNKCLFALALTFVALSGCQSQSGPEALADTPISNASATLAGEATIANTTRAATPAVVEDLTWLAVNSFANVAWSPDGTLLAVSSSGADSDTPVQIYDVQTQKRVYALSRSGMVGARFTAFSPTGRWLMVSEISHGPKKMDEGQPVYLDAAVWDMTNGKRVVQLTEKEDIENAMWSPDGDRLAYWNTSAVIRFWAAPDAEKPAPEPLTLLTA